MNHLSSTMTADGSFGGKFKVAKSTEQIDVDAKGQVVAFRMVLRDGAGRRIKILSPEPLGWRPGQMLNVSIRQADGNAVGEAGE